MRRKKYKYSYAEISEREKRRLQQLRRGQRDVAAGITFEMRDEMRLAVKAAEEKIRNQWHGCRGRYDPNHREAEIRAYEQAKVAARAMAREDIRALWARRAAEKPTAIELPPHIQRLNPLEASQLRDGAT